jgi:hypothetical protein
MARQLSLKAKAIKLTSMAWQWRGAQPARMAEMAKAVALAIALWHHEMSK